MSAAPKPGAATARPLTAATNGTDQRLDVVIALLREISAKLEPAEPPQPIERVFVQKPGKGRR